MRRFILGIALLMTLSLCAAAQVVPVPNTMNFQGRLTRPDGTPVSDGSHTVSFTLFDQATGGNVTWSETRNVISRNGVFTILLGSSVPLTETVFEADRWLEINVDGTPLTPRQKIVSSAFALKSNLANRALTVPDNTITGAKIAAGTITADKLVADLSLPPNGAAGGDLLGTYPNPSLAMLPTSLNKVSGGTMTVLPSGMKVDISQTAFSVIESRSTFTQSFKARADGRLVAIDLYLGLENLPSQTVALSLWETEGTPYTQTVFVSAALGWQRFLLTTPFSLIANHSYSVRISVPAGRVLLGTQSTNPVDTYPDGSLIGLIGRDATFVTYVEAGPMAAIQSQVDMNIAGKVGIGVLTPQAPLHIANPSGIIIGQDGARGDYTALGISLSSVKGGYAEIQAIAEAGSTYGDLSLNRNGGNIGIGKIPAAYRLDVNGSIRCIGSINTSSDARYKQNIATFNNALDTILNLRGVTYDWNRDSWKEMQFPEGRQVGFIAQEVEKVLPELVHTDKDGYKSVAYQNVVPVLVEAVKTLKRDNDRKDIEIKDLKTRFEALLQRMERLEQNTNNR